MSWETNKKILMAMFMVNLIIGLSFAYMGAWLVLPFAGLEVAAVALATYYVCWKLNSKETIAIESESLILKKGVYYPTHSWHWQTSSTRLLREASKYRLSAPTLYLQHINETVEIGSFLNRSEKKDLLEELKSSGMPVVQHPNR